jgi:hypothetical protein
MNETRVIEVDGKVVLTKADGRKVTLTRRNVWRYLPALLPCDHNGDCECRLAVRGGEVVWVHQ